MKTLVLIAVPLLAACAACGGSSGDLFGDGGSSTSPGDAGTVVDGANSTPIGDAGTIVDNGGTVQFSAAKAYISRGDWCGTPPPFTSHDEFELRLVGPGQKAPLPTIQIVVYATAPVQIPQALTLIPWQPAPAPSPGDNDVDTEDAYSNDAQGNSQLGFSFGRGMTPSLPDPSPYDQATLTVLAIPKKEGDTLQVRTQLHFTDGAILDETFVSPPLVETTTACGGR